MIRVALGFLLLGSVTALAADAPLLKPAVPAKGFSRVDFPLSGGEKNECFRFNGFMPPAKPGKDKTSPGTAITIGLASIHHYATEKALKNWGYTTATVGKQFTLPSITLVGEATIQGKRSIVHVKTGSITFDVVKTAYGSEDNVLGADLMITLDQTLLAPPGQSELWMTFAEGAALQVSYPTTLLKKMESVEDRISGSLKLEGDRLPFRMAIAPRTYEMPMMIFNGKPASAKARSCVFDVSMANKAYITLPMVKEYEMKWEEGQLALGQGADKASKLGTGTATDLRLTAAAGAGFKTPTDLYVQKIAMTVDVEAQYSTMFLTPEYFGSFVQSLVLATGTDGATRLYGTVEKKDTLDPKAKK